MPLQLNGLKLEAQDPAGKLKKLGFERTVKEAIGFLDNPRDTLTRYLAFSTSAT